jgi:hypothetical protein
VQDCYKILGVPQNATAAVIKRAYRKKAKELQDNGKLERGYALSWELYRVMNGTDPNYMLIDDNNYLSIDDETIDIDYPWQIEELKKKVSDRNAV